MPSPYVYERQSEYWTSRQIEEFFLDLGFEVIVYPMEQVHENLIPADFLFFDQQHCKLFGFQYKALYGNGRDFWPIDGRQHDRLARFPWIYYCLIELRHVRNARAALHSARIVSIAGIPQTDQVYPGGTGRLERYSRWGAFYEGLESCRNGVRISSREELFGFLMPERSTEALVTLVDAIVDTFVVNFESRHMVHLSPFLRDLDSEVSLSPVPPRLEIEREIARAREQGRLPDFAERTYQGIDLSGMDLGKAGFEGATLQETNLEGANLEGARLRNANLSGSNLRRANMSGADLRGANLQRTTLSGTNLRGAKYTRTTKWPSGFDPSTSGADCEDIPGRRLYDL